MTRAVAAVVHLGGHLGQRLVLNDELHHEHQRLLLVGGVIDSSGAYFYLVGKDGEASPRLSADRVSFDIQEAS